MTKEKLKGPMDGVCFFGLPCITSGCEYNENGICQDHEREYAGDIISHPKTVEDLNDREDLALVSEKREIIQILHDIGYLVKGGAGKYDDYGCLFVGIDEGDYMEVWGCESNIPYLNERVDKLL